ncbi:MAG: hypothetical protein A2107_03970 [Verrucomicrobia bacterium GWF2_62_7]|nr:MAG: hypothetical protein A2107_03970 [Verrucomicrobia bacterium GWF2_62_7]
MTTPNVVILSAGRGFRMYPFTVDRPVTLCTVANVPLLQSLLRQIEPAGFHQVFLALPARAMGMKNLALPAVPHGFHLEVFSPKAPALGQVGNVREATSHNDGPTLVLYGDSFLSVDFLRLIECHQENRSKGALATILYHRPPDLRVPEKDGRTYHGVMSVDQNRCISRFVEKPKVEEILPGFDLANAAVFIVENELMNRAEFQAAKNFSFDIFEPSVRAGLPIYGCDIGSGFRFDAGGIARWQEVNIKVIRREINAPIPGTEILPSVWVGAETDARSLQIEPPVLVGDRVQVAATARIGPEVILGNCCRIGDGAVVRNSIMMDNCWVGAGARLDHCLVGPHCKINNGVELPRFTVLGAYAVVGSDAWPVWAEEKEYQYEHE